MSPTLAHALTQVDPRTVGSRIKAARIAAGMTQPELGGDDASPAYVSRIESGHRQAGAALLESLAARLGVSVDFLVLGDGWENARRLELDLDLAELNLAGGAAAAALDQARRALATKDLLTVPDGPMRAAYVEAAALDSLGDPTAADSFKDLLAAGPGALVAARAATALSRILRERGEFDAAISCGEIALDGLRPDLLGSEDGVRLAVTLAAALFMSGRVEDAAALCDAAVAEAEKLASPIARASAYWNASMVRSETGDLEEALVLARSALSLLESTERVRDLGRLRVELGSMMLRANPPRVDEAQRQLRLADAELDWSAASPADVAWHQTISARALVLAGDFDEGRACALHAVEAAKDGALPLVRVEAMTLLGQLAWAEADRDEARGWFRHAIAVLTGVGSDRDAAQLWVELGALADQAGLVDEARDAYRRAAAAAGLAAQLPPVTRSTVISAPAAG